MGKLFLGKNPQLMKLEPEYFAPA